MTSILRRTTYIVEDIEKSISFYRDGIGLNLLWQTETELNAVRSKIENHRKNLQSQMLQGQKKFEASMNKTNMGAKMVACKTQKAFVKTQKALGTAKTTKQLENTFKAGKRAFQDFAAHVKQRSPDLFIKLFDHEDLEKAQREIGKFENRIDRIE